MLNHGATAVTISLAEPCTDLLTDRQLIDSLTLEPQAVAVLSS
jgi:Beta-galactosidase C-terminal domain